MVSLVKTRKRGTFRFGYTIHNSDWRLTFDCADGKTLCEVFLEEREHDQHRARRDDAHGEFQRFARQHTRVQRNAAGHHGIICKILHELRLIHHAL